MSLTITVGLPGSGKSFYGEQQRQLNPSQIRIVNRDDIRAANGTRFEDGDESYVAFVRDFMIEELLNRGYHVICTDTNLSDKVKIRLLRIATKCGVEMFTRDFTKVSLETCLSRNDQRWADGDCKVPNSAIISMYEQFIKEK